MKYTHSFKVRAALGEVARFHSQSSSMAAITPPPVIVRVHKAPEQLTNGAEMDFTLWLGPLPVRWKARMEAISLRGFVDRQIQGPFESWVHTHSFIPVDARITEVRDEIEVTLKRHPFWGLVGRLMWLNLPVLFAFRGRKTRRLLEKGGTARSSPKKAGRRK